MLQSLTLSRFKSFQHETIRFGRFTVLIGANASGKSNILDAIRFLQGCSSDLPLAEVLRGRWEGGREVWPGIRGGAKEAAKGDSQQFRILSSWRLGGTRLDHSIHVRTVDPALVESESLRDITANTNLFDTHAPSLGQNTGPQPGGGIPVAMKRVSGGTGRSPVKTCSAHRSLLNQMDPQTDVALAVSDYSRKFTKHLRDAMFLNITPARMREYVPRQQTQLGAEGENLSAVLWQLCQDEEERLNLVDWLTELVAPELKDIEFIETQLGDVLLAIRETDGTLVSARSMSDGTLRFLGELTALRSAPEGSLLLIEEIENGLHPQRAGLLVEMYESMAEARDLQVIATTHSPAIVDALSSDSRRNAVVCARVPNVPGTVAKHITSLASFNTVFERQGIDRMMKTGWLERSL